MNSGHSINGARQSRPRDHPSPDAQPEPQLRPLALVFESSLVGGLISYLSTATKWGKDHAEVLQMLFTTGAWLPRGRNRPQASERATARPPAPTSFHAGAQPSRCFWPMGLPAVRFCSGLREKTPVQAFRLDHEAAHTTTRH